MTRNEFLRVLSWAMPLALAGEITVSAQNLEGYASVMFDLLPNVAVTPISRVPDAESRRAVSELRVRLFAESHVDVGDHIRLTAAGFADGLAVDRALEHTVTAAVLTPQELHAEFRWSKADVRVGLSRVVWGRLDEFLPTDVVNPLDLSRFLFEGRVEGRMPVAMIRGRALPSDRFTLEAIYVPLFRRGRFDQLDEETSPFNLAPTVPILEDEPHHTWDNGQGGLRVGVTTGRVDWSVSAYRGFEPLPVYVLGTRADAVGPTTVEGRFPRFTMLGADFETVGGEWGLRGEAALFADRTLQIMDQPIVAQGKSVDAGLGLDRRAGNYHVSMTTIVTKRMSADPFPIDDFDATIAVSLDRSFARETRHLRTFAVYNPGEDSAFARLIASFSLRDNVTLETSGGWFSGSGADALGRFATRDFVYGRLKVFF